MNASAGWAAQGPGVASSTAPTARSRACGCVGNPTVFPAGARTAHPPQPSYCLPRTLDFSCCFRCLRLIVTSALIPCSASRLSKRFLSRLRRASWLRSCLRLRPATDATLCACRLQWCSKRHSPMRRFLPWCILRALVHSPWCILRAILRSLVIMA